VAAVITKGAAALALVFGAAAEGPVGDLTSSTLSVHEREANRRDTRITSAREGIGYLRRKYPIIRKLGGLFGRPLALRTGLATGVPCTEMEAETQQVWLRE